MKIPIKNARKVDIFHVNSRRLILSGLLHDETLKLLFSASANQQIWCFASHFSYISTKTYRVFAVMIVAHLQLHFHIEHSFSFRYIIWVY